MHVDKSLSMPSAPDCNRMSPFLIQVNGYLVVDYNMGQKAQLVSDLKVNDNVYHVTRFVRTDLLLTLHLDNLDIVTQLLTGIGLVRYTSLLATSAIQLRVGLRT